MKIVGTMHRKYAAFYQSFLMAISLIRFILLIAKLPAAVECVGDDVNRFSVLAGNDEEDATKIESLTTDLEMQVEELKENVNLRNENIAESSKQKQQQQKGILNLADDIKEYKINMDKLITLAVKLYQNPPTDVQMEEIEKEAKRKLKSDIFKTYLLQNVSMEVQWPQWAKDNLYRNIQRILEEIKKGKHREYEQKKFNLIDENQLRRLFDFVQRKFKSANKIQLQKKMFGLYLAMNNLSSPNDNQKEGEHKFVYKLTKAQRYHLSGYIQKIFYNHFDLQKDNTMYTSRWQNARKKSKRIAAIKAPSKDSNVDKVKLHNMIDHLIRNPTKRMIRTWHKFSTLFEIAFGLYVNQMDGETAAMSKQQIQDLDMAILDIMFDGTDFIGEKKLRKFILNKFVKEENFYQKVKAGDLEEPLRKILKEYKEIDWKKMPIDNLKWKMDEVSYRKKLNLWLESLIYEILYEMVDPELNLEFGSSDIVKEARQAVNDSFGALQLQPIDQQQQQQHHPVIPQQSWQWWYVPPSVPLVRPGFYVPDPSASAMTYYDYNMQHIIYSQIQAARNHLNAERARSFMPVDPSISYASAARYGRRQSTVEIREIEDTNSPSHDHHPNMPLLSGSVETDHSGRNHVENDVQQQQTKDSPTATYPSWQNMQFGTIDYPTHSQIKSTDRDDGIDNSNEQGN